MAVDSEVFDQEKEQQSTAPETTTTTTTEDKPAPAEVTKRSIRLEIWQKIRDQRLSLMRRTIIFNKIPNFLGAEKAAELLAETEEFKKSNSIKVNIDLAQEQVKLEVIKAHKKLFVPPAQKSSNVYAKIIKCNPDEVDLPTQKQIIKLQGTEDTFQEIDIEHIEKLDMVVVGSCAVSRQGQRIGKGNGYVDLDIGILAHLGIITPETLIVTTVHDVQVYDTLPEHLFESYDLPLDLIVTPTEVIRVAKRLPRPSGIQWSLLSSRRLEIVPVLKAIKEREEKNGTVIELKDEDTDVEGYQRKARQRRSFRSGGKQRRQNRFGRRTSEKQNGATESHGEEDGGEKTDGEAGGGGGAKGGRSGQRPRNMRRRQQQRRRSTRGETGGESGAEKSEGEDKAGGGGSDRKRRPQQQRQKRFQPRDNRTKRGEGRVERDLCIRVTNISRSMRVTQLKAELKARNCYPMFINWNGYYGKCYLHFQKKADQNDEEMAAELLKQLENLTLTVTPRAEKDEGAPEGASPAAAAEPKQVTLKCEIMQRRERGAGGGGGGGDNNATSGGGDGATADGGDGGSPKAAAATNGAGGGGNMLEGSRIETTDVTAV